MGVFTEYFGAVDDDEAREALEWGPAGTWFEREELNEQPFEYDAWGRWAGQQQAAVLEMKGVVPGTCGYFVKKVLQWRGQDVPDFRSPPPLADDLEEGPWISQEPDEVLELLATITPDEWRRAAESPECQQEWFPLDECWLLLLGELARQVLARDEHLYCWTCL